MSDCWTVHPNGSIDFTYPEPDPAPFTTIAWRLAHVIVGVFAMRNHSHFGGPEAGYETWPYATDAATALRQLDEQYRTWIDGVRGLSDDDLSRPCGPAEGPYADYPMTALVLHINREVIHHGAEIACMDLPPRGELSMACALLRRALALHAAQHMPSIKLTDGSAGHTTVSAL